MKNLIGISLAITLTGCAALPEPTDQNLAQFVVPINSTNDSSKPKFGYRYVMRFVNQDTNEKNSIEISPTPGLKLAVEKNLQPGNYCFVGYFNFPIKEEGTRYKYDAELHKYSDCFELKAGALTVWSNNVKVHMRNDEKIRTNWWQNHKFLPLANAEKESVITALNSYKNIELWQPVLWTD